MNDTTFQAFSSELTKIALYQTLKNGFVRALKEGWHGTQAQIDAGEGQSWFGKGRVLNATNRKGWGRVAEEAASLGGLTRALPIGNKSLMLLGTGLMARSALRPQDPSGQGRTRVERVSGLVGNTLGGLAGGAIGMRLAPKSWLAPMATGIIGSAVGEKLTSAPFKPFRHPDYAPQQPQQDAFEAHPRMHYAPVNQGAY